MAEGREDRSGEDLTEEASPHRLEEYRRKGIVAQSRELTALATFFACAVTCYAMAPKMGSELVQFMRDIFRSDFSSKLDLSSSEVMARTLWKALKVTIGVGLPICAAGFIMGIVGSFIQVGSIFSTETITPDFEKINPLQGFSRLISLKQLIETARICGKIALILAISYFIIKSEILTSPQFFHVENGSLFLAYANSGKAVFFALSGVLVIFAAIDFGFQKFEYNKNLRMTKQEAKQEHKEREGDPQIRARIRAVQREMARKRMMQAVKKADVIVTNPTHIAVALVYDKTSMAAPKVVAKGADFIAQRIKKVASDAGVPMVENVALARTLYKTVKVGQAIPRALYQAVAEVLAHVYRLRNKRL